MKFEKNDRYFSIAVYVFLTWVAVVIVTCLILKYQQVGAFIREAVGRIYLLFEPLIIGLVLAYLLAPLVHFYEKRCCHITFSSRFHLKKHPSSLESKRWHTRTVPTLLTFMTLLLVVGIFALVIKLNIDQVAGEFVAASFRESIKGYVRYFEGMITEVGTIPMALGIASGPINLLERIYGKLNTLVIGIYQNALASVSTLGIHTMNWLLGGVIAFYLLQDSERVYAATCTLGKKLLRNKYRDIWNLFKKADQVFASYIRGELLDSGIIVILTSVALTIIQLDFAIIIGVISGIFNLIPYFGPIVGFCLAIVIGLLDPNPMKAIYGGIAILVIQQIDGWFIVPHIVGDSVKLHPVIVLLVIVIGGNLFGLIGMFLSVPIAAFIRVLLIDYLPDSFGKINDGK